MRLGWGFDTIGQGKVKLRSRQGQGKLKARSRQGKVKARLRKSQCKVKARSRPKPGQGEGEVKAGIR